MSIPELLEAPSIEGGCGCGENATASSRTSTPAPASGPNLSQNEDLGVGVDFGTDFACGRAVARTAAPIAPTTSLNAPTVTYSKALRRVKSTAMASLITSPLTSGVALTLLVPDQISLAEQAERAFAS